MTQEIGSFYERQPIMSRKEWAKLQFDLAKMRKTKILPENLNELKEILDVIYSAPDFKKLRQELKTL